MRGLNVRATATGELMKKAREKKGMTLERAVMLLGFSSINYLSRCERGDENFPATKLKRASEVYEVPTEAITKAAIKDYRDALELFLSNEAA